jgi:uncharacterized membrane protein
MPFGCPSPAIESIARFLGDILLDKFSIAAAFRILPSLHSGIVIFALAPALAAEKWANALLYGALFGFLLTQATISQITRRSGIGP